jgi:hypothetical protein
MEPAMPQAEAKEPAASERWGLPEYPCKAEETVMAPEPSAAVPEPQQASTPEPEPRVLSSVPEPQERPVARAWTSGSVARPTRGRQTIRFAAAAASRPAVDASVEPAPAVQPASEPVRVPVTEVKPDLVEAAVTEQPEEQAGPVSSFDDIAEAVPARMSVWAELMAETPPEAPEVVSVREDVAVTASDAETIVVMPAPEPLAETVVAHSHTEAEQEVPSAATRLGGLRTLMTSLGIKNLHKEMELRKLYPEQETVVERSFERSVFAQPIMSAPSPSGRVNTPAREVIALPEILPPRAALEHVEREADLKRPVPRVSRWETADDVETLPSKRGQYRKRV